MTSWWIQKCSNWRCSGNVFCECLQTSLWFVQNIDGAFVGFVKTLAFWPKTNKITGRTELKFHICSLRNKCNSQCKVVNDIWGTPRTAVGRSYQTSQHLESKECKEEPNMLMRVFQVYFRQKSTSLLSKGQSDALHMSWSYTKKALFDILITTGI